MRRISLVSLVVLTFAVLLPAPAAEKAEVKRTEDVVYGRKFGVAMTMDVFQPEKPNGAGIILAVSGGWVSSHDWIDSLLKAWMPPMLERGYTVFAVCHGCQPKFAVPEILEDMHRAVRFIRHNSSKYGVDPNRFGIMGASAGGHLSLMMGATGTKGKEDARDPVNRESSAIQCVACFVPPTDFLNYGQPGEDAVGVGKLKDFRPAFGLATDTAEERQKRGKEISPIYYVTSSTAPTLIVHGEKDPLVPVQQAQSFIQRCEACQVPAQLIVREGKGHAWNFSEDLPKLADWFDKHLAGKK